MTEQDIQKIINESEKLFLESNSLRKGQCYIITLNKHFPEICKEITGTKADCFYQDENINNLFTILSKITQ